MPWTKPHRLTDEERRKGGKNRVKKMTPEQRRETASKGGKAFWAKYRKLIKKRGA
jgi:general stress protein YciG